jgi:hypothetical protein
MIRARDNLPTPERRKPVPGSARGPSTGLDSIPAHNGNAIGVSRFVSTRTTRRRCIALNAACSRPYSNCRSNISRRACTSSRLSGSYLENTSYSSPADTCSDLAVFACPG